MRNILRLPRTLRQQRSNERGDTIVEVLIAVGVLGAVLGGATVVVNRNIKTNLAAQERLQVTRLAERQVELYRVAVGQGGTFLDTPKGNFCMYITAENRAAYTSDSSLCNTNAVGEPAGADDISFAVAMSESAPTFQSTESSGKPRGKKVRVHVEWDSIYGNRKDMLDYGAEVYENN